MKEALKKIFNSSGHYVIYGMIEYGRGYSRKIRVFTIAHDPISGPYIDEITSMVARACDYKLNKKGQINFRGCNDIEDIRQTMETVIFNNNAGLKARKL